MAGIILEGVLGVNLGVNLGVVLDLDLVDVEGGTGGLGTLAG